jgi:hypothetical protein
MACPKYLATARETMDTQAAAGLEMYDKMARITITPRWVRYYDFGVGRIPRFLHELAEQKHS